MNPANPQGAEQMAEAVAPSLQLIEETQMKNSILLAAALAVLGGFAVASETVSTGDSGGGDQSCSAGAGESCDGTGEGSGETGGTGGEGSGGEGGGEGSGGGEGGESGGEGSGS